MSSPTVDEKGPFEHLDLRVELEWDIPENTSCPMATHLDENPKDVTIHNIGDTCYMEVDLVDSSNENAYNKLKLQESVGNCSCPSFWKNGCQPRFQMVENMTAVAEVFLSSRGELRNLISDLRKSGRDPSIRNLTITGGDGGIAEIRTINVANLTEREKECIEFAVREGYYDRERKISLQDIAEEFDVNKSTCSERLGSAESKIVKDLFRE